MFTSHWVLAEYRGSMSQVPTRRIALRLVDSVQASPRITVVSADAAPWERALGLYRERPDKEWSLVDCVSIIICEQHRVRRVFKADKHFVQAGFEILL